jgi:molybdopterin synthase sulfur carrier subunit
MNLLYFAWVRQKVGKSEEQLDLPESVGTVHALAHLLKARGGGYGDAFADLSRLRAAVNQEHVPFDSAVSQDDEVAFFSPVTGG